MLKTKQLAVAGCFVFFIGCVDSFTPDAPEDTELARVGTYSLTLAEALSAIQVTADRDSAAQVKLYVNNWVKSHVVLQKAETELYPDEKKFSKQLEEYRNSLIRYTYEQKYVNENLDTNVSDKEIAAFYNENHKNFELKENIVRVRYLYLPKKKANLKSKAKQILTSNSKNSKTDFLRFMQKNKLEGYWNDSSWVFFADVLNLVPIETYNTEDFLRSNRYYETIDSAKYSLIAFKEFKIKDSSSPLEFEKEKIRRIILNQRKRKLIEEMEMKIYDEALKEGDVKIEVK
ncbi:MAG: hypothetical protein NT150_11080 [Bacteroidetes bacterium]|nr:hypothetical protein [Bacteroidota bacterium]